MESWRYNTNIILYLHDGIRSWSDFCPIFVCFTFGSNSEAFFERYISSRLHAFSNKQFTCCSLGFICSLRNDTNLVGDL